MHLPCGFVLGFSVRWNLTSAITQREERSALNIFYKILSKCPPENVYRFRLRTTRDAWFLVYWTGTNLLLVKLPPLRALWQALHSACFQCRQLEPSERTISFPHLTRWQLRCRVPTSAPSLISETMVLLSLGDLLVFWSFCPVHEGPFLETGLIWADGVWHCNFAPGTIVQSYHLVSQFAGRRQGMCLNHHC